MFWQTINREFQTYLVWAATAVLLAAMSSWVVAMSASLRALFSPAHAAVANVQGPGVFAAMALGGVLYYVWRSDRSSTPGSRQLWEMVRVSTVTVAASAVLILALGTTVIDFIADMSARNALHERQVAVREHQRIIAQEAAAEAHEAAVVEAPYVMHALESGTTLSRADKLHIKRIARWMKRHPKAVIELAAQSANVGGDYRTFYRTWLEGIWLDRELSDDYSKKVIARITQQLAQEGISPVDYRVIAFLSPDKSPKNSIEIRVVDL